MKCGKMSSIDGSASFNNDQITHDADMLLTTCGVEQGGGSCIEPKDTQGNSKKVCHETETIHTMNGIEPLSVSKEKEQEETEKGRRHTKNTQYEQHSERRNTEHNSNAVNVNENEKNEDHQKLVEVYKKDYNSVYNNLNNGNNSKRGKRENIRNDVTHFPVNAYVSGVGPVMEIKEKSSDLNSFPKRDVSKKKNKMELSHQGNFGNLESGSNVNNSFGQIGHRQESHNYNSGAIMNIPSGKGYKMPLTVSSSTGFTGGSEPAGNVGKEFTLETVNNIPLCNIINPNYNCSQGYFYNNISANANYGNVTCSSNNTYGNGNAYMNINNSNSTNNRSNNASGNNTNTNSINNNSSNISTNNSINNYNNSTNFYLYTGCAEENGKNCECQAYYASQMYNPCYTDGMSRGTVVVAATTAATPTAVAASSAVAGAEGHYDLRYAYVVNDYCNFYPYNGNYYYFNANNSYYNMNVNCANMNNAKGNNVGGTSVSLSNVTPLNYKKENTLMQDKTNNVSEIKDSCSIYEELKNRVVDIFKRENMMTDEYLLYYVYNNVKLNLSIIAKHPHISSVIGSNLTVLQDVLNDLKHYDVVNAENGKSINKQTTSKTAETVEKGIEKKEEDSGGDFDKTCDVRADEAKVDIKKNESRKEASVPSNEKREDEAVRMEGVQEVENEVLQETIKEDHVKFEDSIGENVKHEQHETDDNVEMKKKTVDAQKAGTPTVNEKEKKEERAHDRQPEEASFKNDVVTTEEDNKNFLLNLNNKRNTIIIRDIYAHLLDKIKELVHDCPSIKVEEIMDIKNECNNTIFITLKNPQKTETLAQYLKEQTVDNSKLNVRIKSIQKIQNIIENNIIKKNVPVGAFGITPNNPNVNVTMARMFSATACGEPTLEGFVPLSAENNSVANKTLSVAFLSEHETTVPSMPTQANSGCEVDNSSNCAKEKNNESANNSTTVAVATVNIGNGSNNEGDGHDTGNNTNGAFLKTGCENTAYGALPSVDAAPTSEIRTPNDMPSYYILPNNMMIAYDGNMCANNTSSNINVVNSVYDPALNYYYYAYNDLAYRCNIFSPMNSYDTCSNSMYNVNNVATAASTNLSPSGDAAKSKSDLEKGIHYVKGDETKVINNEHMNNVRNFYMDAYNSGYANNYANYYAINYMNTGLYPYNYAQTYYQYNVQNMYGNNFKGGYNGLYTGGYNNAYNSNNSNKNKNNMNNQNNSTTTTNNNNTNNINNNNNDSSNNNNASNNNDNNNNNNGNNNSNSDDKNNNDDDNDNDSNNINNIDANDKNSNNNVSNNNKMGGENKKNKFEGFSKEAKNVCDDGRSEKHSHNSTRLRKNGKREIKGANHNGNNVLTMSPVGASGMASANHNNTTATGSTASNSASRFSQRNGKAVMTNNNNANGNFTKNGRMKYNKKEVGNYDNFLNRNAVNVYGGKWNNYFLNRRGRFDYERKVEIDGNVDGTYEVNKTNGGNNGSEVKDIFNFDNSEVMRMRKENMKKMGGNEINTVLENVRDNNEEEEEEEDKNGDEGMQSGKYPHRKEHEHGKDNEKRMFKGDKNKIRKETYLPTINNDNNNNVTCNNANNSTRRGDYNYSYSYHNEKKDYFKNTTPYDNNGNYNSTTGNGYNTSVNNNNATSRKTFKFCQRKDKYNTFYEDTKGYRGKNTFDSAVRNNSNNTTASNNMNNTSENNFSNKENDLANSSEKNDVTQNDITSNVSGSNDLNKNDSACIVYTSVNSNSSVKSKKMNDSSKNLKKYSFVDIVDSCKKIKDVKPPECIDNLMKENVSLFRKRDDQFCWKLNVC